MPLSNKGICFLIGAGASQPVGIPTMEEMWDQFIASSPAEGLESLIEQLRNFPYVNGRNIEALLKYAKPTAPPNGETADDTLRRHTDDRNKAILAHEARKYILSTTSRYCKRRLNTWRCLSRFARNTEPLDVFSLNYDTVVEDYCSSRRIPYVDGFNARGIFTPDMFTKPSRGIRIWKLHGSVTWHLDRRTGDIFRKANPYSIFRRVGVRHTASLTQETGVIWPAGYGESRPIFKVMRDAFESRLIITSLLIVVGYRFGDGDVRKSLVSALRSNSSLRVLLICGGRSTADSVRNTLITDFPEARSRVTSDLSGLFPHALETPEVTSVVTEALHSPARSYRLATSTHKSPQLLCMGSFTALTHHNNCLYLLSGDPNAEFNELNLSSGQLRTIARWKGHPRGLTPLNDTDMLVLDSRWMGYGLFGGIGVAWSINIQSGARKSLFRNRHRIVAEMIREWKLYTRVRAPQSLRDGLLSWPTSALSTGCPPSIWITESRALVRYDPLSGEYLRATRRCFFNLARVTQWTDDKLLLLEHVRGNEGCIWEYSPTTHELQLLLGGIIKPGGMAAFPKTGHIVFSASTTGKHPAGPCLWCYNANTRQCDRIDCSKEFDQPSFVAPMGSRHIAVATRHAVFQIEL